MSVSIKYKGEEIASASIEVTKTIKTAGKYCEADILVENTPDGGGTPVIQPLSVSENGTYTAPAGVDGYSPVTVNVSGGGSLPSVISKLDGGSFTLASDAVVNTHKIAHNLGVVPKGFAIWCDELDFSTAESTRYLAQMLAGSGTFGTAATQGIYTTLAKTENATNALRDYVAQISGTNYSGTFNSTKIGCILTSMSFHGNKTYKWLAWA